MNRQFPGMNAMVRIVCQPHTTAKQSLTLAMSAVVDKSRHLGAWHEDVMFASKIVDKIIAVHSSMKSVTRRQHEIYLIFTITG